MEPFEPDESGEYTVAQLRKYIERCPGDIPVAIVTEVDGVTHLITVENIAVLDVEDDDGMRDDLKVDENLRGKRVLAIAI